MGSEGQGNVVVQGITKLRTGITQGMRGENGVSAGKSKKKKTSDTHVDGWIILSLTIKETASVV